ncbi:MAG TPA: Chromate resistance protein ChrB [Micropepsaceae bacterium]|nr:Chromate resistance protein ChrB [Micropepsaceae bacterium]
MPQRRNNDWILLLAQLPTAPSSARVSLWRRLRASGAASLANGAWALPASKAHDALLEKLAASTREQGGAATVFHGGVSKEQQRQIIARFAADRAREYAEFADRSRAFLDEIKKERRLGKFTFAELEEIDDDFAKLSSWLGKIEARDFFSGKALKDARARLSACETARAAFAESVYEHEGIEEEFQETTPKRRKA